MKTCESCGGRYPPSSNRQKRCNACRHKDAPAPGADFGTRTCALCGKPFTARAWNARFCCKDHAWRAHRPKRAKRYENAAHRRTRKRLEPIVALGQTPCARCGKTIQPGEPWDLDHDDDGIGYRGPSHARCNRATARHAKDKRDATTSSPITRRGPGERWHPERQRRIAP